MEQKFPKSAGALNDVFKFIDGILATESANPSVAYAVNLAVEELFTNMVKYSLGNGTDVTIGAERRGNQIVVTLVEEDVEPFDATHRPAPDTTLPLGERTVGGLGIHLVKQMVDGLHYHYEGRRGITTITKTLEQ